MVITAACKVLNGDYDATVTEAFVVDEGIRLAKEMELHRMLSLTQMGWLTLLMQTIAMEILGQSFKDP